MTLQSITKFARYTPMNGGICLLLLVTTSAVQAGTSAEQILQVGYKGNQVEKITIKNLTI